MTGFIVSPEWSEAVRIVTIPDDEDPYQIELVFGVHERATNGFDMGLDIQAPPPPPGSNTNAYFEISDALFGQLFRDIRNSRDSHILWTARIFNVDVTSADYRIEWDSSDLPDPGNFTISFANYAEPPVDWFDMRDIESIPVTSVGTVYISFSTHPLYCITGSVLLSDGEVANGANIFFPELGLMAITDSTGTYTICNIPQGTWTVIVSYDGYNDHTEEVTIISDTDIDFTLHKSYTISGYIHLSDG
jgi:hypothetical protein